MRISEIPANKQRSKHRTSYPQLRHPRKNRPKTGSIHDVLVISTTDDTNRDACFRLRSFIDALSLEYATEKWHEHLAESWPKHEQCAVQLLFALL